MKAARVDLIALPLADGLGGKAYALFSGVLAEVEIAAEVAASVTEDAGALVRSVVIAQLHGEMADNLRSDLRFGERVRMHRVGER